MAERLSRTMLKETDNCIWFTRRERAVKCSFFVGIGGAVLSVVLGLLTPLWPLALVAFYGGMANAFRVAIWENAHDMRIDLRCLVRDLTGH